MLFLLLPILLGLFLTLFLWRRRNLPPGPWGLPVLGYLPWISPKAPYLTLSNLAKKYGSIYGLSLGSVYTVVLTNTKTIRTVFTRDATTGRAPLYLTHGIMNGYGLICAEGEMWKDQRKFVHTQLRNLGCTKIGTQRKNMETLILHNVNDFVTYIKEKGHKVIIDPLEPLRHSVGSVMNSIVFGKNFSRDDETWKWLQFTQEEGTKHIGVAGPLNFLPFMRFVPKYRKTMEFLIGGKDETHELYNKFIKEQIKLLENDSVDSTATNFIQAFLLEKSKRETTGDAQNFYCDKQFHHLLGDLFGAGLDTTLTTLSWFLLYVAKASDIQQKLKADISDVLQSRPATLEDISALPLMEATINEVQRIRSVVPVGIPHGAVEDMEIDGYFVPKGTMIVPLQWQVHMDEQVWTDPEKFDPWRFINEEGKCYKPENFIPFQTGKRMCVGDELARMLLFLFGTTILQNFSIALEDESLDFEGECGITLTPKPHKLVFSW